MAIRKERRLPNVTSAPLRPVAQALQHDAPRLESRFAQFRDIAYLGLSVYSPAGFARFLMTPLPRFGCRRAISLLAHGTTEPVRGALVSDFEGLGL